MWACHAAADCYDTDSGLTWWRNGELLSTMATAEDCQPRAKICASRNQGLTVLKMDTDVWTQVDPKSYEKCII